MALWDQSMLARDGDFNLRIAACVSNENSDVDPLQWAAEHQWGIAAAPGFADAYSSAVAADVENPGRDPSVISDAQILAAVQALASAP
jgi:hypothetical protein